MTMPRARALALALALPLTLLACADEPGSDADSNTDAPTGGDDGTTGADFGECSEPEVFSGDATYYELAGNPVNCGFPTADLPPYYAALNGPQYGAADYCGACILAEGPAGSVELLLVDQCPECAHGDIDLSPAAFEQIAALEQGRVDVSWRVVPCSDAPATLGYRFKDGSSQWWTAVQVVGHRTPIVGFEYQDADGEWVAVERLDYNYFVEPDGMGEGPLSFRVTDAWGRVVEDTGVPLIPDESVQPSAGQFPGCE